MTSPLHGGGRRFESGRAHLFSVRVRGIPIIMISRNPALSGPACCEIFKIFKNVRKGGGPFKKKSGHAARRFPKMARRDIGRSKKKFAVIAGLLEKNPVVNRGFRRKSCPYRGCWSGWPPVHQIRAVLIRAHIEPGLAPGRSNRSPIWAPI